MEKETKGNKTDEVQHVGSHIEAMPTGLDFNSKSITIDAQESLLIEHNQTPLDAIKAYPMAIFWCLVISTCVIMEGYDQILVQSFYAYPQFQLKYGEYVGVGTTGYQVSAAWQAGLTNASGVGAFFGTLINGFVFQGKFSFRVANSFQLSRQ